MPTRHRAYCSAPDELCTSWILFLLLESSLLLVPLIISSFQFSAKSSEIHTGDGALNSCSKDVEMTFYFSLILHLLILCSGIFFSVLTSRLTTNLLLQSFGFLIFIIFILVVVYIFITVFVLLFSIVSFYFIIHSNPAKFKKYTMFNYFAFFQGQVHLFAQLLLTHSQFLL